MRCAAAADALCSCRAELRGGRARRCAHGLRLSPSRVPRALQTAAAKSIIGEVSSLGLPYLRRAAAAPPFSANRCHLVQETLIRQLERRCGPRHSRSAEELTVSCAASAVHESKRQPVLYRRRACDCPQTELLYPSVCHEVSLRKRVCVPAAPTALSGENRRKLK